MQLVDIIQIIKHTVAGLSVIYTMRASWIGSLLWLDYRKGNIGVASSMFFFATATGSLWSLVLPIASVELPLWAWVWRLLTMLTVVIALELFFMELQKGDGNGKE